MRELQVWDTGEGLEHAFADIEDLARGCRFRDCSHDSEPGCAVTAAAAGDRLDPARLASYRRLKREEEYLQARLEGGVGRDRRLQAKRGSKALRQMYKLRRR
jgi:ribosome biogenesis GTPase